MTGLRLYKIEKLRSEIAIGQLFDRSNPAAHSVMAYPLRAVWTVNPSRLAALSADAPAKGDRRPARCPQFLIAVPKKKIRHAVDRVQMRRRIREAYRLNRHLFPDNLPIDVAFIYVASEVLPYADVLKSVSRILNRISKTLSADTPAPLAP
ncbi:MAG: ribonuclease P protein component [Duncaniella sp.]|nr:ribonuclease P protein component [Duncaniella sp.]MDE6812271.1 ribonuclease P protein component [Duncaniella sp.]